jgi:Rod binding domain-containing protein
MDTTLPLTPATAAPVDGNASRGADPATAHKTAQDFEALFLSQVFENMFQGIGSDSLFGGGSGETIYRSLLLQQYSKVAAKSGGVGIADAVQREMLRAQEAK